MLATEPNNFFREKRSFKEVKQEVLGRYFSTWCEYRLTATKAEAKEAMLYIDLQAGGGADMEGSAELQVSTTDHLYRNIVSKPLLNETIQTCYYDRTRAAVDLASDAFETLPYYQELLHPPLPLISAENKALMSERLDADCPALIFMDPFASGGYAQQVLLQGVNRWRSDMLMLLRPDNISRALIGKKIGKPLLDLFGDRLTKISSYCRKEKDNHKRQEFILDYFISWLQEKGNHTLLFKVNLPDIEQPDHYLLFSSPNSHAYRIFKETILPYSTFQEDGIPIFVANEFQQPQLSLFEQRPAYTLANLVEHLTGQASLYKYKSIEKIYELDNSGTNYIRENYVAAFEQLRKQGKIELLNAKTMQTIRQPTPASVVKYRL